MVDLGMGDLGRQLVPQRSSSLYESLLESIGEAVIALDAESQIIVWNTAAEQLYGWQKAEVLGRPIGEIIHTTYNDPEESHGRARATVAQAGIWKGKVKQSRKDGSEVIVDSTVRVYVGPAVQGSGLIAINRDISEDARLQRIVQENNRHLQELSRTLIRLQERERAKLAREFHDEIGQSLTAIFLNLRSIRAENVKLTANTASALTESMEITSRLMEQIRSISLDLHPKILEDLGFIPALRWLINRTGQLASITIHFDCPQAFNPLAREVEFELFRIAQEALTNMLRHASARNLDVRLLQERAQTTLILADDGVGFPADLHSAAQAPGMVFGLHSMFARAELIGAQLHISGQPGAGTVVKVVYAHADEA